jgi:photosystem II stability/assembly factor-like uncharacterized protein
VTAGAPPASVPFAASAVRPPAAPAPRPAASAPAVGDPLLADLYAVVFVDAQRGWAAGAEGALLATVDGGNTWSPQTVSTRENLYGIAATADGRAVVAVGASATVVVGADQGRAWTLGQLPPMLLPAGAAMRAVAIGADGRSVWTVGDAGAAARSGDGGRSWTVLTTGVSENLRAVHFARDGGRGFAAGQRTLVTTTDGGASWRPVAVEPNANWTSMAFDSSGMKGLLVGAAGAAAVTKDAGQTWSPRRAATQSWLLGASVSGGGERAWSVGLDGTVLLSVDDGPWERRSSGAKASLHDVLFDATGRTGLAIGGDGAILRSGDAGRTWTARDSGSGALLTALARVPERRLAWAVGANGTVLSSVDDGESWRPQASNGNNMLLSIDVSPDGQRGWIGGLSPLLATQDGGRTWQVKSLEIEFAVDVRFLADGQRGYVLNGAQRAMRTADGGLHWENLTPLNFVGSRLAVSPDGTRLWVAGSRGRLAASADAGRTWRRQPTGTEAVLNDVEFLPDALRGWAVGHEGTLIASRDGGTTWSAQASGSTAHLRAIQILADGKRGFVAGDAATLLGTADGGDTWAALAPYSRNPPPWSLLALACSASLFAFVITLGRFRAEPGTDGDSTLLPQQRGALARLLDDRPLTDLDKDLLGHRPAVLALSAFMRNRDTEPKLTIAITAPWGMGKSSMMGMLRGQLEDAGLPHRLVQRLAPPAGRPPAQRAVQRDPAPGGAFDLLAAVRRLARARPPALGARLGVPARRAAAGAAAPGAAGGRRGARPARRRALVRRPGALELRASLAEAAARRDLGPFAGQAQPVRGAGFGGRARRHARCPSPMRARCRRRPTGSAARVPAAEPCREADPARKADAVLRTEVYCYLQRAVVLQADGERDACGVKQPLIRGEAALRKHGICIFESADQLFEIADAGIPWKRSATVAEGADPARYVLPSERKAIVDAAEVIEPPPCLPTIEHFVPLLALLGLLVTKGLSVYGFQLLSPLRSLLGGAAAKAEGGNEPTGTVERYRTEFCLLTEALDGRLVVFVDDLDRCDKPTVNGMLEMTNYLIDHGRVFIVIGAAMEHCEAVHRAKVACRCSTRERTRSSTCARSSTSRCRCPCPPARGSSACSTTPPPSPRKSRPGRAVSRVRGRPGPAPPADPARARRARAGGLGGAARVARRERHPELPHVAAVPVAAPASAPSAPIGVQAGAQPRRRRRRRAPRRRAPSASTAAATRRLRSCRRCSPRSP